MIDLANLAKRCRGYRGVVLVGPPRAGKSTFARMLRGLGYPTLCADPESLVKESEPGVTYLPEIFASDWSGASRHVADNWLMRPGPFCCEGVGTVRALRKVLDDGRGASLADLVIVRFSEQYEHAVTKDGQRTMAKAIDTIWGEIAPQLGHVKVVTP